MIANVAKCNQHTDVEETRFRRRQSPEEFGESIFALTVTEMILNAHPARGATSRRSGRALAPVPRRGYIRCFPIFLNGGDLNQEHGRLGTDRGRRSQGRW